jgi:hypothetical protein
MTAMIQAVDLKWVFSTGEDKVLFGILSLNEAILYEIVPEEDTYNVWFTPEECEAAIYLWHFCDIEDAKRYVEKREKDMRSTYTITTTSPPDNAVYVYSTEVPIHK